MGEITKRYVLWNNKGGVGKSTLAFHLGSLYAENNPDEKVLVLDLCPQANATMTYLGGGTTGENHLIQMQQRANPETIVGYFMHQLQQMGATQRQGQINVFNYVKQVSQYNNNVPSNLYLIPGDGNLELMLSSVSYYANPQAQALAITNAWRNVLMWARDLCDVIAESIEGNIVVFIDTNPSFALYTQQAIVASDQVIVPFNADDSSRAGVGALFGLIYGLNIPHPVYQNYNFSTLARQSGINLPLIHLFVGNRFTQFQGTARAFAGLANIIQQTAWTNYQSDPNNFTPSTTPILTSSDFSNEYCVDLRDFNSAGVVAANYGTPLFRLNPGHYFIYGTRTQVNPDQIDACRLALDNVIGKL
ncbi:ParA family protein [Brevibacillus sp. FSL K6-0770]|uniref:ParA family protein n=1 Tax=Brevibacillus sp. FSL K6-0770 TaxID=2954673 RepID=UPI0030FBCE46